MPEETRIAAEVRRRMAVLKLSPKALSLRAGLNETYVRDLLAGRSKNPKTAQLQKLAGALACTPAELTRSRSGDANLAEVEDFNLSQSPLDDLRSTTPVYEIDVHIGMGGGGLVETEDYLDTWQLPTEWLRSEVRARDLQLIRIVTLEGDSMVETLQPGDKVIVDLGRTVPSPPGLFVLWDGLAQVAKRLEYIEGSAPPRIRVISDNSHYPAYERTAEEVRIVGRIMGRWQRLS